MAEGDQVVLQVLGALSGGGACLLAGLAVLLAAVLFAVWRSGPRTEAVQGWGALRWGDAPPEKADLIRTRGDVAEYSLRLSGDEAGPVPVTSAQGTFVRGRLCRVVALTPDTGLATARMDGLFGKRRLRVRGRHDPRREQIWRGSRTHAVVTDSALVLWCPTLDAEREAAERRYAAG
jgi:hypothetical protein